MQRGSMTDREAYPTAWITLAVLVLLYLLWRFALGAPTVSRCWVWEHWHVYCPGCGGTRALMALAQGRVGAALWYHTPVVITLALAAIYLFSQTAWRLRGKRGWVLRYDRRWPMVLVGLFLANCVVRNVLWLGLCVPLLSEYEPPHSRRLFCEYTVTFCPAAGSYRKNRRRGGRT